MPDTGVRHRRQEVAYLGFLEAKLRDLRGISTLVYEFIQNTDDVKDTEGNPGASKIIFDIRDDALFVTNDGVFRDEDYKRLELVAGGEKREEIGTTGAFGIGFISVYQITDYPEIMSSGLHWIIRPDADLDHRIEERDAQTEATLFRLPWAFDADSSVREKLRLEAIEPDWLDSFQEDMVVAITLAAPFLKQVKDLQVKRNGQLIRQVVRDDAEDDHLLIQTGDKTSIWRLFRGEFDDEAASLKAAHSQIEEKRRSQVVVAIPDEGLETGRLFAVLPSESLIPLPFHINADFFPSSDRKRILFSEDYQGEWNRSAIRAAARALAGELEKLPTILNPNRLWKLIKSLDDCNREAEAKQYDRVYKAFWEEAVPYLSELPLIYTATGSWVSPRMARLLEGEAERSATAVLMNLGIEIVSPSLSSFFGLLRRREIGVSLLNAHDIIRVLQSSGLEEGQSLSKASEMLRSFDDWRLIWQALDAILKRPQQSSSERENARYAVVNCPLVWDEKQVFYPPHQLARGDEETRALFKSVHWLDPKIAGERLPAELVPVFSLGAAVDFLKGRRERLEDDWHNCRLDLPGLYNWLEAHKGQVLSSPNMLNEIRALSIWPVADHLRPLTGLYIPGGFEDPFRVSELVDIAVLGGRREFLKDLGVQELDFSRYVRDQLPRVLQNEEDLSVQQRRQIVRLLAARLGEIRDSATLSQLLARLPLVECKDDEFYPAGNAYLPSPILEILDRSNLAVAKIPKDYQEAVIALYRWLGIAEEPRPKDLLDRVHSITCGRPTSTATKQISSIVEYLIEHWSRWTVGHRQEFAPLKEMKWLPGVHSEIADWYKPRDLFAVFQQYLFETQAVFLDLSRIIQSQAASVGLMDFLGIPRTPPPTKVVAHLLHCCHEGQAVNREVYRYLNQQDNLNDPSVELLKGTACLLLSDNTYVRPDQIYWNQHPFGRYRAQLGSEFRLYDGLLERLGVQESPSLHDYIQVLLEIGAQYGKEHKLLDEETDGVVLRCWEALSRAIEEEQIQSEDLSVLEGEPVIRNEQNILIQPENIYFEDRPGLKEKLPELGPNVIRRPPGAWRAMEAVGAKMLGQAVRVELVDPLDAKPDMIVTTRFRERNELLRRVTESDKASGIEGIETDVLSRLSFSETATLVVRYTLERPDWRIIESEPESIPARLLPDFATLAICHDNGRIPWPAIACEAAYAVKPSGEIGGLASGIKEALMYETYEEAERVLDELGYPRFELPLNAIVPNLPPLSGFGGQDGIRDEASSDADEHYKTSAQDEPESSALRDDDAEIAEGQSQEITNPPETGDGDTSTRTDETPQPKETSTETKPLSVGPGFPPQQPPHTPLHRRNSRIRTYVAPDDGSAPTKPENPEIEVKRSQSEKAGIEHVMKYEVARGRVPEEMPPLNPGFDIRSVDRSGEERFIEVKALSGRWEGPNPAQLTRYEYEKAREKEDEYWLYVVEFATSDAARIYPIQNPVGMIQRYLFDHGWMGLAKEEEPEEDSNV